MPWLSVGGEPFQRLQVTAHPERGCGCCWTV